MLTQIRHIQKGTLIVVTILIVIAFAFLYSDFDFVRGTVGKQNCVVKVYDRCYRQKEAQKLASHYDVAFRLGMYDFATVLFGENRLDQDRTDFILSLVILRTEAAKLGIEPTAEEIKAEIPKLPIFQQPWVTAEIVENNILGPNGFTDGDLAQLVKDYLAFQKLRELIGSGVEPISSETDRLYTRANQLYTASLIRFDRDSVIGKTSVDDAEVKEYYEENKGTLLSEPKRSFDFVKFIPNSLPEDATNEQRAKANLAFANAVNRAYSDLADDGANFVEVAKQYEGKKADFSLEVGVFEPFPMQSPPEALKEDQAMLETLFSDALQIDDVTVPVGTEDGGYYVFHYSKLIEPEQLTLEQAKPAIVTALTAKKSNRAVNDAANEARAKLTEALDAGKKSFADAVKAAGVEAESMPPFSRAEPPADTEYASLIVQAAQETDPKRVSTVVELPEGRGFLLLYLDKIEIYEDEDEESAKRMVAASTEAGIKRSLFSAWFNQRRQESNAERSVVRPTLPYPEPEDSGEGSES